MKIIKKINNNVVVALDGNHREVILFGKGLGFEKIPCELEDLSRIDRTFYDISTVYYPLLNDIDMDLLNFIDEMMDVVKAKLPGNWNPATTFIIADHINFCLNRIKSGLTVNFPYSYELEVEFPEYNKMAKWIVVNINKKKDVQLEKGEITSIAMHLITSSGGMKKNNQETIADKTARILREITYVIENHFQIKVDKKDLNYYRFRYHVQYLVKRKEMKDDLSSDNRELFENMKNTYPDSYQCVCKIGELLQQEYQDSGSDDELLYLMIHINRLVSKNQIGL